MSLEKDHWHGVQQIWDHAMALPFSSHDSLARSLTHWAHMLSLWKGILRHTSCWKDSMSQCLRATLWAFWIHLLASRDKPKKKLDDRMRHSLKEVTWILGRKAVVSNPPITGGVFVLNIKYSLFCFQHKQKQHPDGVIWCHSNHSLGSLALVLCIPITQPPHPQPHLQWRIQGGQHQRSILLPVQCSPAHIWCVFSTHWILHFSLGPPNKLIR